MVQKEDSDGEDIVGSYNYMECDYNNAPYTRIYVNVWDDEDEFGGSIVGVVEDVAPMVMDMIVESM